MKIVQRPDGHFDILDVSRVELQTLFHPHNHQDLTNNLPEPYKCASATIFNVFEPVPTAYGGHTVHKIFAAAMSKVAADR